jgi:hypothetical protein
MFHPRILTEAKAVILREQSPIGLFGGQVGTLLWKETEVFRKSIDFRD